MIRIAIPLLAALIAGPACAQGLSIEGLPGLDTRRGNLLIYGNYCGPGNRAPAAPIDALDRACMHHDACSPPRGEIATCGCNGRLHREAEAVAQTPGLPDDTRDMATFIADAALAMPCR